MRKSLRLRQQRERLLDPMRRATERAERANRDLNADERREFDRIEAEYRDLTRQIHDAEVEEEREAEDSRSIGSLDGMQGTSGSVRTPGRHARGSVALTADQSVAAHVREAGHRVEGDRQLGLGKTLRGILTGDWRGADLERRALWESTPASAGTLVPAPMAANVIDLARAKARVMQAGALTVPMESSTLKVVRQTGDPSLSWHAEGDTINESGLTFDAVTLTAKTLPCLVKFSLELFEDVDNLDQTVEDAVAKAIALEIDKAALRGTGTNDNPKGIRNQSGVTVIDVGTDGAVPTWETLVDGVAAVRGNNFDPNAAILAERTERNLGTQRENADGSGAYLAAPPYLDGIRRFSTTQVPTDLTHGTASDASEIYVGQWRELLVGMRTQFAVKPLNELYADTGEMGVLCYARVDVAPAHGGAFAVLDGVTPSA